MKIIEKLKNELSKNGVLSLKIKVIAGAKKNSVEEYTDEIVKIKINKPAVEGKANKAIIDYLSELFEVPKSNIEILRGEKSSQKDLRITLKNIIIS